MKSDHVPPIAATLAVVSVMAVGLKLTGETSLPWPVILAPGATWVGVMVYAVTYHINEVWKDLR